MPRGFNKRVLAARLGKWRGIGGDHVLGDFTVVMKGERQYRADLKFGGENRCADCTDYRGLQKRNERRERLTIGNVVDKYQRTKSPGLTAQIEPEGNQQRHTAAQSMSQQHEVM